MVAEVGELVAAAADEGVVVVDDEDEGLSGGLGEGGDGFFCAAVAVVVAVLGGVLWSFAEVVRFVEDDEFVAALVGGDVGAGVVEGLVGGAGSCDASEDGFVAGV